jgi:small subunit ribosomal protein S12
MFIGFPHRKATCLRLFTLSPKKPNSANRKVLEAFVQKQKSKLNVKIPGEKHTLQQHSTVLLKPCRVRDLIGINTVAVRGKFDLLGVANRRSARSIYGIKR